MYFGAWRVNGSLSVSRAIGDAEHKPYISGEPDVEEFILEGNKTICKITLTGNIVCSLDMFQTPTISSTPSCLQSLCVVL